MKTIEGMFASRFLITQKFSPWCLLVLATTCLALMGCKDSSTEATRQGASASSHGNSKQGEELPSVKVSQVPLRIFIVGRLEQPEALMRQWLAETEQPAEIRAISVSELFSASSLQADILVYPSRLLGELTHRQWVVRLPEALRDLSAADDATEQGSSLSSLPGLITATSYDGFQYGVPLGFSIAGLMGSPVTTAEQMSYNQLNERLADLLGVTELLEVTELEPMEWTPKEVDAEALVDRFLSIAFGVSQVNAKYGVLFEVRTMKSRLNQPEFVFAAELLKRLARQKEGIGSVLGTHSFAWQWVQQQEAEAYAIVSPGELDLPSRSSDQGRSIPLKGAKNWNLGGGLIASLTAQCRQSAQSIRFVRWLAQDRTIASLEGNLSAAVAVSKSTSSLADRVNQQNLAALSDYNLSCEPRLRLTYRYRELLAAQLVLMVSGQLSVSEGLSASAGAWDSLTTDQFKTQQREYERSLGMTQ